MGFMLGDPFNYNPVRKLAESFRVETGILGVGEPNCPDACGNADATARPYTLKEYYQEAMQSGGDLHHNRPFTRFFVRGDVTWKDDDYTLKLNDVAGDDGATKLDVEPGWLVRLNIGVKDVDVDYTDFPSDSPYRHLRGTWGNPIGIGEVDSENIISINMIPGTETSGGYYYGEVLLDGDEGDYVSIDLDSEHGDISQFVIKVGGYKFALDTDIGKLDNDTGWDQSVRVELLGVSYKPYFEEDDDTDDSTNDNTDDNTDNTIVSCYQNEDCLDGEICESGTCVEKIEGCTDPRANEYDSSANVENGTCISCQTGYDKDSDGLFTVCADGYTADAAGVCYADDEEEEAFPWLYVAGIGVALVLVLS